MKLQGIYLIKNRVNNKIYIGSSISLGNRWGEHLRALEEKNHHNEMLQFDYSKYGYKNFTFEVLEIFEGTKSELLTREGWYIEKYKSYLPEIGYNKVINTNPLTIQIRNKNIIDDMYENEYNFKDNIDEEVVNKMKSNINIFRITDIKKFQNYKFKNFYTNTAFCKAWFTREDSFETVRKMLLNYFRKINQDRNYTWTSFVKYEDKIKDKSYTKGFVPLNNISMEKHTNLAFVMNIYPNYFNNMSTSSREIEDMYSLSLLLRWIVNNADLDKKVTIFIPSKRMADLLSDYLESI